MFAAAVPRGVVAVLFNCVIVLKIKPPILATLMSTNNNNKVVPQILIKHTVPKHLALTFEESCFFVQRIMVEKGLFLYLYIFLFC